MSTSERKRATLVLDLDRLFDPDADGPEVTDGAYIVFAGHDAFIAVGQERFGRDPAFFEGLVDGRVGNEFGRIGRDSGFNEDKVLRRNLVSMTCMDSSRVAISARPVVQLPAPA